MKTQYFEKTDLGLLIKEKAENILVMADFHIGYEEALNKQGIFVPRMQFKDIIARLNRIFNHLEKKRIKLSKIIVNGDIKHEFGKISDQEWRETLKTLDLMASNCKEVVLIRGNHDKIIGPIAQKRSVSVAQHFIVGKTLIIHGNEIPEQQTLKKCSTIIIAHEHPAVSLRDSSRVEKYKCFLEGKYKAKNLIVIPSFCLLTEGTDILTEKLLSPFLSGSIRDFKVYVLPENPGASETEISSPYYFGKVSGLLCR